MCLLLLAAALVAGESGNSDCPFIYERHSLDEIVAGTKRPWLYDGIFHNFNGSSGLDGRHCINCQRGRCAGPRATAHSCRHPECARAAPPQQAGWPAGRQTSAQAPAQASSSYTLVKI